MCFGKAAKKSIQKGGNFSRLEKTRKIILGVWLRKVPPKVGILARWDSQDFLSGKVAKKEWCKDENLSHTRKVVQFWFGHGLRKVLLKV